MKLEIHSSDDSSIPRTASPSKDDVQANWQRVVRRRSFLHGVGAAGAVCWVGGAGGVGSILIQIARKLTGLTVIATASRPETKQ